jgi:hypothetical protein
VLLAGAARLYETGAGPGQASDLSLSLRNRCNSQRFVSLNSQRFVSLRAPVTGRDSGPEAFTHRPNLCSLIPSSRATVATARPVLTTSFTALSL